MTQNTTPDFLWPDDRTAPEGGRAWGSVRGLARPKSSRCQRVASVIQEHVAQALPQIYQWDPFLTAQAPTVRHVRMAPDLRLATIAVAAAPSLSDAETKEILRRLKGLVTSVRRHLAQAVDLKFVPQVRFVWDDTDAAQASLRAMWDAIAKDAASPDVSDADISSSEG